MTIQVTVRHETPGSDKKLLLKIYERGTNPWGGNTLTLVSEVTIDPGEEHTQHIWGQRSFEVLEIE